MPQPSPTEVQALHAAITTLDAQRALLGSDIVDTALDALREKLTTLYDQFAERKRLTILFADVSGYTAMSTQLEVEDVAIIMNDCFEALTAAIVRYGGTVAKYAGDNIMALFGAPRALENHEELAVRAALGLQAALTDFSRQLHATRGLTVAMRVGLNTGEVYAGLVGGGAFKRYDVMGDTVNVASRLEHACPVGGILISEVTTRSLAAVFELTAPQSIEVKGKSEPIVTQQVLGLKAQRGATRGFAQLNAPLIGRDELVRDMLASCEAAYRDRQWRVISLSGEVGLGKSRLQRELLAQLSPAAGRRFITINCYAHTQLATYHVLTELVRALLRLTLATDTVQLAEHLHAIAPEITESDSALWQTTGEYLLGLTPQPDRWRGFSTAQRHQQICRAVISLLAHCARSSPVLLVLEDVHWIDETSLDWLRQVLLFARSDEARDRAVTLIVVGRPPDEVVGPLADLWTQLAQPPCQHWTLTPLTAAQSGELIRALLTPNTLPAAIVTAISERAQGNPFFIEEVLRLLIDEGTLNYDAATGWQVTPSAFEQRIPADVQDVLAAQLDRLPPDRKQAAQRAAVIGRTFWQDLLAALSPEPVEAALIDLQERRFITRQAASQLAADWEWLFQYVLMQEVAYATVTRDVRLHLHQQAADWLVAHAADRPQLAPVIAHHCEQSGQTASAYAYWLRAADQAAAMFANRRAVEFAARALRLAVTPLERYEALDRRQKAWGQLGQREQQRWDLGEMQALADTLQDEVRRARVLNQLGLVARHQGHLTVARDLHLQAVTLFRRQADRVGEGRCCLNLGTAYLKLGERAQSQAFYAQAIAIARETGERGDEANALTNLGTIYFEQGDQTEALTHYQQARAIHAACGDLYNLAIDDYNIGEAYHRLHRCDEAEAALRQALTLCRDIGDAEGEAEAVAELARVAHTRLETA